MSFQDDVDYHNRPEVSNSKLTQLKKELEGIEDLENIQEIYDFGNLVDAMITEPDRIDFTNGLFDGAAAKDFDLAYQMRDAFMKNESCRHFIKNADFQKISVKDRDLSHVINGEKLDFNLACRCKWDFFNRLGISGDIKTTSATSQKAFVAACERFDYFRSRAWYMDLEGTDRDVIIGISKVNMKIFFIPIRRNDENYMKGLREYSKWAFKYYMLKT